MAKKAKPKTRRKPEPSPKSKTKSPKPKPAPSSKNLIVVAGDTSVDTLLIPRRRIPASHLNWQLYPGTRVKTLPGGAFLLTHLVKTATGDEARVASQPMPDISCFPPGSIIHSLALVDVCPRSSRKGDRDKAGVYRVCNEFGYDGPDSGAAPLRKVARDDPDAAIVVLDDAGNGFRDKPDYFPAALTQPRKKPVVIYKVHRPLMKGGLWDLLTQKHKDRLILVVNVDDLRGQGMDISRRLSWERTAMDFVYQMRHNDDFKAIAALPRVIVTIGLDGALLYTNSGAKKHIRLFLDPDVTEDGFTEVHPCTMFGLGSAFVAALTAEINRSALKGVESGIRRGLQAARSLLQQGYGDDPDAIDVPADIIFKVPEKAGVFPDVEVKQDSSAEGVWSILKTLNESRIEDTAFELALKGTSSSLWGVPVGTFGKLKTLDRGEIEAYQAIRNLMHEYMEKRSVPRPLSIAVFGPPGSGKSFGVSQVAATVDPDAVEKITFNVAQFTSPDDLVKAFHIVRDIALAGKVPLVFFDEFDAAFEGAQLGWLKYFLAPMQDGEFKDGERVHPIGKAIFVFAGGTAESFRQFCCLESVNGSDRKQFGEKFRNAKGTDFVSRLRGFIDIMGPDKRDDNDYTYLIRRAMIFRVLIQMKARYLIDDAAKTLRIEPGVLSAFLKAPFYRHGVRSMEAIIDMSMLSDRECYEAASLPSAKQLDMHVDAHSFMNLVLQEVNWVAQREKIARAIQEVYRTSQKGIKSPDDPAMQPWETLREDFRESNRDQAAHIPVKLRAIGYGIQPASAHAHASGTPQKLTLNDKQVEKLAEMEHERYNQERLGQGWVYGPTRDTEKKISPYLVDWDELEDGVKEWDRDFIRAIPDILTTAGFEPYKLE